MARKYEEFHDQDKGKGVAAFRRASPRYWDVIQHNPLAIEEVRKAQEWAEARRAQVREDYEEHKTERVGRESIKVFEERSVSQHIHPALPGGFHSQLSQDSILEESRRRVWAQAQQEEAEIIRTEEYTIDQIVTKARIENMSEETKTAHLKADMHKAVEAAQAARTQARKLFNKDRDNLLFEARESGSETPERDVSITQAKVMKDIDRQEHKDLHAVFKKYGWSYENRHAEFSKDTEHGELHQEETQRKDQGETKSADVDRGSGEEQSHKHER